MPANKKLGTLERVALREVWGHEASDFTPWLAREENIALLGDAIRIDLEVDEVEKPVGAFSADILCKDTANDKWVVIENQLEPTNHGHLGQILTYAAAAHFRAAAVVSIAQKFRDEHRAAVDWLNEMTGENLDFFGLEVELWRIGESDIAPKFNIVSMPNNWGKEPVSLRGLTSAGQLQLEYWGAFCNLMEEGGGRVKRTRPRSQSSMRFPIGRSGFGLNTFALIKDKEQRIEVRLFLGGPNSESNFCQLEAQKDDIEQAIGESLEWRGSPEGKERWIVLVGPNCDLADREDWGKQHRWLYENLEKFHKVFMPRVKALAVEHKNPEPESEPEE